MTNGDRLPSQFSAAISPGDAGKPHFRKVSKALSGRRAAKTGHCNGSGGPC